MTKGSLGIWRAIALVLAVTTIGCSDGIVAPDTGDDLAQGALALSSSDGGETTTDVFTVNPNEEGGFVLGGKHKISFPKRSICDPATSGYGPSEWDEPCTSLDAPITITAVTWTDAGGHPRVEFSPSLRFVPTKSKQHWVQLKMYDPLAAADPESSILYCGSDGVCVDESATDPTLETDRNERKGTVTRRIKHFSGYMVSASRTLETELY